MRKSPSFTSLGNFFETPWTIRQTETHLIFGPLSRHLPVGYPLLAFSLIWVVFEFFTLHKSLGQYIGSIADKLVFFAAIILLLRLTCRQQAIVAWAASKLVLALVAFMLLTEGTLLSALRHQSDVWPNFLLGLIWLPHLEFLPKITPYQKYITIFRMVCSIPCIIWGVRSGSWHWN